MFLRYDIKWTMGISDHLTCLLRSLYAAQEATVRTGHEQQTGFKSGEEELKAVYCHDAYLTYMQSQSVSSVTQSCPTLCDPMNHSTPGLPVHHKLPEFTQTHVHRVCDAIQPSPPLSSPSPPDPNPSQHQRIFQWVNSSHEVAKLLEFQLQHQSFQWTPRIDLL